MTLFTIDLFFVGQPAFVLGAAEGSLGPAVFFQHVQGWKLVDGVPSQLGHCRGFIHGSQPIEPSC